MIVKVFEDPLRRIVREEIERRLAPIPRSIIVNESGPSEASAIKFYRLVFENELPDIIYTSSKIEAKGGEGRLVKIALYDIRSKSIVTTGPLSSLNVEICVVQDDKKTFGSGGSSSEEYCWTTKQFKANIIRQMGNDRGMLFKGDLVIQLKNGVGYVNKLKFIDNSSRTSTKLLRLGAIAHSASREAEVKEALSNHFRVMDIKREANQKRYPPFQNDPIWRLEKISKGGEIFNWLSGVLKINTVRDLVHVHQTNPSLLQEKYGAWLKKTINHAKTCIEEVAPSHGQNCTASQQMTLNLQNKGLETVKHRAYNNNPAKETMPLVAEQCSAPPPPDHHLPITTHQDDQEQKGQDIRQSSSTSKSQIGEDLATCINIDQFDFSSLDDLVLLFEDNDFSSLIAAPDPTIENHFP